MARGFTIELGIAGGCDTWVWTCGFCGAKVDHWDQSLALAFGQNHIEDGCPKMRPIATGVIGSGQRRPRARRTARRRRRKS